MSNKKERGLLEARTITSVAATSLSERLDHNRHYQDRVMINYTEDSSKYSFVYSNIGGGFSKCNVLNKICAF